MKASLLCDGYPDCENKSDEAGLFCDSWKYKSIAVIVILVIYCLGFSVATYYECQNGGTEENIEMDAFGTSERVGRGKVIEAFKTLLKMVKDPKDEEEMKLRKLNMRTNLELMKLVWNIEMKNKAIPGGSLALYTLQKSWQKKKIKLNFDNKFS